MVTGLPSKGGTLAVRKELAMQPPVVVPWNGGPATPAQGTPPEGAKVTLTLAPPLGSSGCLQPDARAAAALRAALAAPRSNSVPLLGGAVAIGGITIGGGATSGGGAAGAGVAGGKVPVSLGGGGA